VTWLVVGSSGFLGANLGRFLHGRVPTVGVSRMASPQYGTQIISDLANAPNVIRAVRPDVVVNAAALASNAECDRFPETATRVNAQAPGLLAAAAQDCGATFVQISTDAVFDGRRGGYCDTDEPSPWSVYGQTKLDGEAAALAETDALVARVNFFGWSPSGSKSILEFFVNALREGRRVVGYTDITVTSSYVDDLCMALWTNAHLRGIQHMTAPDAMSKYAFGRAVAQAFDLDGSLIEPAHSPHARNLSLIPSIEMPTQRDGIVRARG
jgi:dTDP-4-dehydrorhamnose reductase